jgi:hypothetical protein
MTVKLSEVEFINDFYSAILPDNSTLYLNRIDEDFITEGEEVEISGLNIEVVSEDESSITLYSSVIGLEQEKITITTDYTEYLGKILTLDNMKYCRIEVKEDE